jgi:lysozyme
MIEGVDVSSANGPIDWARVKAAGIGRVGIRALIGRDTRDSKLLEHANGCRAVDLPFFVYGLVYPRHRAPQDADEQGRQLASISAEVGAPLPAALDVEDGPPGPPTGLEWLLAIAAYVEGYERTSGQTPTIYTSPYFWLQRRELLAADDLAHCPLWIADWTDEAEPALVAPWVDWTGWQYASSARGYEGRVDGVTGMVDRSRWRP